jgi:uncharacterized protein (DUF2384 family)
MYLQRCNVVLKQAPEGMLAELESQLGLSSDDLARTLGVSRRTLERWRSGETYPQREARRRLVELSTYWERVRESFTSADAARGWLHEPSRYLGGLTPADALRAGRIDRAEGAMEVIDSGIFL